MMGKWSVSGRNQPWRGCWGRRKWNMQVQEAIFQGLSEDTREVRGSSWQEGKLHERTKDKEQQQCILVFQQRRIPFKYLTFHELFKNSNTCYLWNIWKVQEGIKKYKKEKHSKDYFCEFCGLSPIIFLSVCIYNKHTHVFFYKLRYYESSLGCCLFSFPLTLYLKHFPTFIGTLNNWIERKQVWFSFFEKEKSFRKIGGKSL